MEETQADDIKKEKTDTQIALENEMIKVLRQIYDPEIPVNIYDLGLIYKCEVDEELVGDVVMTLTTPNCPVADSLPQQVNMSLNMIEGLNGVNLDLTFRPPWTMDMMSDEAKLELGML